MSNQVNVCYYPTTAVFLDDHRTFLNSLPLVIGEDIAMVPFIKPEHAIDYINEKIGSNPICRQDCVTSDMECNDGNDADFILKLNVTGIPKKVTDKNRFMEPSVLVVDYDMPGQNGLEVCRAIKNPYVKKILLTGVANESIGLEALNDNTIDYYIKKNTPNVFSKINDLIRKYQLQYFHELSSVVRGTLKTACHFMDDEKFKVYFLNLIQDNKIVEYYFNKGSDVDPCSFTLATGAGRTYRLRIHSDELFEEHIEIASDADAPDELVSMLHQRTHFLDISSFDFYYNDTVKNWQKYLCEVMKIEGQENYYCALDSKPSIFNEENSLEQKIFSYREYLLKHNA
ncbi:MAG: response regulator [Gammaproteobacteria bacterium]|nr:MAG: response regulator [Gammaproteobacteria bacterium]